MEPIKIGVGQINTSGQVNYCSVFNEVLYEFARSGSGEVGNAIVKAYKERDTSVIRCLKGFFENMQERIH